MDNEKLTAYIDARIEDYLMRKRMREVETLDRRAEYVGKLSVVLAALAGLAVVGGVVWAVTR